MKRLAIIISYHTLPEKLEESLLSLLEHRPDPCEILVVLSKPYENPYELNQEEVRFITLPQKDGASGTACEIKCTIKCGTGTGTGTEKENENEREETRCSIWESFRMGLAHAEADHIYLMPAGVHFQTEWLEALNILEQSEDLGAFVLDENLEFGGLFKKELLKKLMDANADEAKRTAEGLPDGSEAECFASCVTLLQEDGWFCGVAAPEGYEAEYAIGEEVLLDKNVLSDESSAHDPQEGLTECKDETKENASECTECAESTEHAEWPQSSKQPQPEPTDNSKDLSANAVPSPSNLQKDPNRVPDPHAPQKSSSCRSEGGLLDHVRTFWNKIFPRRAQ
ncbi:MAG: hypothetical protein IJD43_11655 [Thermoguttaceae bacterium]|nr:hypothetical protein [Thermoguttaceae bacterium]